TPHLGAPPPAPNGGACAPGKSFSVDGGGGCPPASMAPPPMSPCSNSKLTPDCLAMARITFAASAVTSCPMPSPGSTAILNTLIAGSALSGIDLVGTACHQIRPEDGDSLPADSAPMGTGGRPTMTRRTGPDSA